jgi:hypothetical protein
LADGAHVILGRNQEENEKLREASLSEIAEGKMVFLQPLFSGPAAVVSGGFTPSILEEAGRLIVRHGKKGLGPEQLIEARCGDAVSQLTITLPSDSVSEGELPMAVERVEI